MMALMCNEILQYVDKVDGVMLYQTVKERGLLKSRLVGLPSAQELPNSLGDGVRREVD